MAAKKEAPDWLKVNEDGTVTVTLKTPLDVNGAKVGYVTMREPSLDDHIAANKGGGDELSKEKALMANLCTLSPADMGAMKMRDFMRVQAAYAANFID